MEHVGIACTACGAQNEGAVWEIDPNPEDGPRPGDSRSAISWKCKICGSTVDVGYTVGAARGVQSFPCVRCGATQSVVLDVDAPVGSGGSSRGSFGVLLSCRDCGREWVASATVREAGRSLSSACPACATLAEVLVPDATSSAS